MPRAQEIRKGKVGRQREEEPSEVKTKGRSRDARAGAKSTKPGLPIGMQFAIGMSVAIAIVMIIGGLILYGISTSSFVEQSKLSGVGATRNLAVWPIQTEPLGAEEVRGQTRIQRVKYTIEGVPQTGVIYRQQKEDSEGRGFASAEILVPEESINRLQADLLLLVFSISVFLIATASVVAWFIAKRVTAPLTQIVADIDVISKGDLDHKTQVQTGGETGRLALAVDRMTAGLKAARDTELELQKRQHDLAVAAEVRQNLLPDKIAQVPGYEIAGTHKASTEVGGDYFDVVPIEGSNRVAILVAEVAGKGIPAALVMTMARAYLRSELQRYPSPAEALSAANRALTRDMRRGMYVTAVCAVLDPQTSKVKVVSAGHKVPIIHWTAADNQIRVITPPGIALGFDAGSVFERTLKELEVPLAAGDRIVLSTSAPLSVKNKKEEELGDKGFYSLIKQETPKNSDAFLGRVLYGLEKFSEGTAFPSDIAMSTIRKSPS